LADIEAGVIRCARPPDFPRVLELWRAAGSIPSVTDHELGLDGLLERDPDALLVAEEGGEVIGTVIVGWDGWRGALYRLAVDPRWRRRGVARKLAEEGVERLRRRGAARVHVIVAAHEAPAVAVWEATGFEARPDQLRLVRTLTGPDGAGVEVTADGGGC
jgi:ribosomal protein S18 acetylase RimI-like enzyme